MTTYIRLCSDSLVFNFHSIQTVTVQYTVGTVLVTVGIGKYLLSTCLPHQSALRSTGNPTQVSRSQYVCGMDSSNVSEFSSDGLFVPL